jgi:hypothetical protein
LCVADQCVPPCTEQPDRCTGDQICDGQTGACIEPCTTTGCGVGEVCDPSTGQCSDGECLETADCPAGSRCDEGQCQAIGPRAFGSLSSGAARMSSPGHTGVGVVGPVEQAGPRASSPRYILQSGNLSITTGR